MNYWRSDLFIVLIEIHELEQVCMWTLQFINFLSCSCTSLCRNLEGHIWPPVSPSLLCGCQSESWLLFLRFPFVSRCTFYSLSPAHQVGFLKQNNQNFLCTRITAINLFGWAPIQLHWLKMYLLQSIKTASLSYYEYMVLSIKQSDNLDAKDA